VLAAKVSVGRRVDRRLVHRVAAQGDASAAVVETEEKPCDITYDIRHLFHWQTGLALSF